MRPQLWLNLESVIKRDSTTQLHRYVRRWTNNIYWPEINKISLEKIEHFKIFATTSWHALFHLARISTHPRAHCHEFSRHWHAKLRACHGVNRLSCQCQACFRVAYASPWLRTTKMARLGTAYNAGHCASKICASVRLALDWTKFKLSSSEFPMLNLL